MIGTWVVKLPKNTNDFDISTIDDLILHVRYTARVATQAAFLEVEKPRPVKKRIFSARAEFPNEWARLMNPLPSEDQSTIVLASEEERNLGDWTVEVSSAAVAGLEDELQTSGRLDGTLQDIWLVCDYGTSSL